jgi:hypothetical protein
MWRYYKFSIENCELGDFRKSKTRNRIIKKEIRRKRYWIWLIEQEAFIFGNLDIKIRSNGSRKK